MYSYFVKTTKNSETVSEKYIRVNNFGYNEDISGMDVNRERGRVDYQLIYVKDGELTVTENGKDAVLGSGSVCLYRPNEPQIYRVKEKPTTFFWIHFSGSAMGDMLSFFKNRAYYVDVFADFERYCRSAQNKIQLEEKYADLYYEGELIALIALIAERVTGGDEKYNDLRKIRPALSFMRASNGSRLSNKELSKLCGLSKYYFMRIFKRATGVSPQQYAVNLTVEKACYLLTSTSYNVSEISVLCGIDDGLYFSRLFKKKVGVSPTEYRNTTRYNGEER